MANMLVSAVTLAVLVALQLAATEAACKNLSLTVNNVEHCNASSLVKIVNFTAVLTGNGTICTITTTGMISVTKNTTATKFTYNITSPIKLNSYLPCPATIPLNLNPIFEFVTTECAMNGCSFTKRDYTFNRTKSISYALLGVSSLLANGIVAGQVSADTPEGPACVKFSVKLSKI